MLWWVHNSYESIFNHENVRRCSFFQIFKEKSSKLPNFASKGALEPTCRFTLECVTKFFKSHYMTAIVFEVFFEIISICRSVWHDHTTCQSIFMNQNVIGHSFLGFEGRCRSPKGVSKGKMSVFELQPRMTLA